MSSHVENGGRRRNKKKKRGKFIKFIAFFAIIIIAVRFAFNFDIFDKLIRHEATMENGWNLILVNEDNYIPDDYQPQLMNLSNGRQVDSRI